MAPVFRPVKKTSEAAESCIVMGGGEFSPCSLPVFSPLVTTVLSVTGCVNTQNHCHSVTLTVSAASGHDQDCVPPARAGMVWDFWSRT
jgi:hypothetical protein